MSGPLSPSREISLLALCTRVLRDRWRIAAWALAGGLLAAAATLRRPALFQASAAFEPEAGAIPQSGIAALAGQLGVSLPVSSQGTSPDFYVRLLKSRALLARLAHDTITVPGSGAQPLVSLLDVKSTTAAEREDDAVGALGRIVGASTVHSTGLVEVTAATKWQAVSLLIVRHLIDGVNDYNVQSRQSQAATERKFVEGREAVASADLRAAEGRLSDFLNRNRQIGSSADLAFQRDRLQRDVDFRQQIYTSLAQADEDVRIREVRDTPIITVVEPPSVSARPLPRGRFKAILAGMILAALVGVARAATRGAIARRRDLGDTEASALIAELHGLRTAVFRPTAWSKHRSGEQNGNTLTQ